MKVLELLSSLKQQESWGDIVIKDNKDHYTVYVKAFDSIGGMVLTFVADIQKD